jgi:UDP-N-acetylglucosamine/UDP-N-acetylgalactosamine diphosphorylase
MIAVPNELRERLRRYGQEHALAFGDRLDDGERRGLVSQLEALDLEQLRKLYAQRDKPQAAPPASRIRPVPVIPHDAPDREEKRKMGESALRRGEVAVLLVAGGQGSRLGFDHAKGMYPVGPVSRKSLFQVHAEKVQAAGRRYGKPLPFLVMTSTATHEETVAFFREQRFFGLGEGGVHFFQQGTMPALDLATGRLLLEAPGRLFLGPDGHGGTLTALAASGLLERMKMQGIRHVFYFQVDNPLVKVADPVFLGHHAAARAEVSSKVVAKRGPKEKVGVFARVDGRCSMIEYHELPDELAHATDENGRLVIWAGNPAIHLFDVGFLERMTRDPERLPFHLARKKVPHIDEAGRPVEPAAENGLKFERFIFDVLPAAERWAVVETTRAEEFAPLKNAEGEDSPATVEQALLAQAADWVTRAGGVVAPGARVEVSPLYALDADELARKLPAGTRVEGERYLES